MYRLTDIRTDDPPWQVRANADILRDAWNGPTDRNAFALRGSIDDKESTDLRALLVKGERWHLLRFDGVATSRPLEARLTAFGQIPYMRDTDDAVVALEDSYAPALLGIRGEMAGFEVGAQYRSVGKRLERVVRAGAKKDQEGCEVWLARRFGLLRVHLSQSELSDNVDRDPGLPRTTKTQTAVTAELSMPAWPVLSVTYGAGDSERFRFTPEGRSGLPERRAFDALTGSAYYGATGWDVTASTTYTLSRDTAGSHDDTSLLYYDLRLSLRPTDSITVTPALSAGREHYPATGTRWDTGSASVTLSYSPPMSRWHAWSVMSYTAGQSSDGLVDSSGASLSGGLGYDLGRLGALRSAVSFEAGYDHYQDRVSSVNSSRGAFAFLLLKVSGF